jgi:hypothetical protein
LVCQDEFFVKTLSVISKKMMSMLLALFFAFLTFFGLDEFGISVYGSWLLPRTLVYSLPGSLSQFFGDFQKICCFFVESIAKSHPARYATPNKRT